jgi:hypothetical protein
MCCTMALSGTVQSMSMTVCRYPLVMPTGFMANIVTAAPRQTRVRLSRQADQLSDPGHYLRLVEHSELFATPICIDLAGVRWSIVV